MSKAKAGELSLADIAELAALLKLAQRARLREALVKRLRTEADRSRLANVAKGKHE